MSARIKPHKVRGRQLEEVREKGPDGRIVLLHRVVDSLAQMLKTGAVDGPMHDAGRRFQRDFTTAQLDPLHAADLLRVPGCGGDPALLDSHVAARRRIPSPVYAREIQEGGIRPLCRGTAEFPSVEARRFVAFL